MNFLNDPMPASGWYESFKNETIPGPADMFKSQYTHPILVLPHTLMLLMKKR